MTFHPVLPVLLVVVIVLPFAALAVWRLVRARGAGSRMRWAARVVLVLACGALLLRPGVPGGTVETLATDVDVVLLVDTTASIVAEDWDGDAPRLDGVRADVERIVASYPGARFALITFDAEASLRVPLTTDTTALATSLAVLRPEPTANSRGSSVGIAAEQLETTLEAAASASPDRARMVFYFGDGEQTASTEPESFAASAREVASGAVFGYGTDAGGRCGRPRPAPTVPATTSPTRGARALADRSAEPRADRAATRRGVPAPFGGRPDRAAARTDHRDERGRLGRVDPGAQLDRGARHRGAAGDRAGVRERPAHGHRAGAARPTGEGS
ncbi:VWA domain-containing protein [Homoserinibacter gongjuensis]|uniref:VWFA domain-containing protein n=1 Tax=Homoserinibacter gongjuensis TaxID=1162968 RepID=A0ABQ6JR21_9MICO|nr:VWA domain-containing protein [Homoserinibacter gongjuensis]GMA89838.1 hypothetical protein GCM10025869_03670 [Homoserinibacter gongjuensis]